MSVTKLPSGKYRARWRTPEGGSRCATFDLRRDALAHLATVEDKKAKGVYIDPSASRITLKDYATDWQSSQVHRSTTAARVASDLSVHILPRLGSRRLGQLRHSEIQSFVKACSEVLSPGSTENVFRVLSAVLSAAVKDRLIPSNPAQGIVLPRKPKVEVVPPTVEEVGVLLAAMPDRYRIAGVLAAGVGLRQGETLGLTVDRIDFLRRQVRIDRQMVTPKEGEPRFGPVKSDASVRTVALADVVLDALSAHLAQFPPGPDGLVVTYVDGRPVRRNRFGAMWRQTEARAGLDFRYHDLRHHFASVLIGAGCSVKVVQKALGDASAKVVLDTYAHIWPDSDDLTRQAVQASLGTRVSPACYGAAADA